MGGRLTCGPGWASGPAAASGYIVGLLSDDTEKAFRAREAAYFNEKRKAEATLLKVRSALDKEMGIRG